MRSTSLIYIFTNFDNGRETRQSNHSENFSGLHFARLVYPRGSLFTAWQIRKTDIIIIFRLVIAFYVDLLRVLGFRGSNAYLLFVFVRGRLTVH